MYGFQVFNSVILSVVDVFIGVFLITLTLFRYVETHDFVTSAAFGEARERTNGVEDSVLRLGHAQWPEG